MLTESFFKAMAAVLNPSSLKASIPLSGHGHCCRSKKVQGTWNTVPMLTRAARRYRGSLHPGVRSTASMPRAAADRKMAPTLVGFMTFSRTATRLAPAQREAASGSLRRRMAQRTPLVS